MTSPGLAADITVVVPSRDGVTRGFIFPCLDSILAQTLPARRVMVVLDDGTKDDTAAQVRARYPDVEVLVKPGKGLGAARNWAIARTDTEYVALLDDDDEFLPQKLARLHALMAGRPELGMAFSRMQTIDQNGQLLGEIGSSQVAISYPESLLGNDFMPPSAALLRRRVMLDVGLFDETLKDCEDYEFFIRMSRAARVAYVDECLIRYRKHPGQMSAGARKLDDAALAVIRRHAAGALPEKADAIVRFYCYGAAVRALVRLDFPYARTMIQATGQRLHIGELAARGVGVLLKPIGPVKRTWRRWEQRRVLGAG